MKSVYFIIHLGKNPPPQNGRRLKSVSFKKNTGFTVSTFPIQLDFSQNQPATTTLNTGSSRTLTVDTFNNFERREYVECNLLAKETS
jgi:hypothetical protein